MAEREIRLNGQLESRLQPVISPPEGGTPTADIDVSVCIANWNCLELLRGCLRSLCRQDQGVRVEVIVVDNASSDGAADMVAAEFPEVVLLRNDVNLGFSRANNQAAEVARGNFLFFLNNDTVVPQQTLARLVQYLEAHPQACLAGPRLRDGDGRVQVSYRRRPTVAVWLHRTWLLRWTGLFRADYRRYRREEHDATGPQNVEVLMGAALFMRRAKFRLLGGWDEDFHFGGEDLELCWRAQRHGGAVYLPDIEITHFGRASTRQHLAFTSVKIPVGFVTYLRKAGCSRWELFLYKTGLTLDAPLQMAGKGLQALFRRIGGRGREADKSWQVVRGMWLFLSRGLVPFWKA